jgi:hypothetical protein
MTSRCTPLCGFLTPEKEEALELSLAWLYLLFSLVRQHLVDKTLIYNKIRLLIENSFIEPQGKNG